MALLIDGYNLLHATDIFGKAVGSETALHASRQALLRFLATAIDGKLRAATTIVFDAAGAPPGLPQTLHYEGITVHFARRHADADELLEEIIEAHSSPRSLTVVSSDHRVQRAARRRGATYIDSDRWYEEVRSMRSATPSAIEGGAKPPGAVPPEQVDYWLQRFKVAEESRSPPLESPTEVDNRERAASESIFPPGYAEDLLEDE